MSLQVCHCGWSKVTSYQGLRIHQGKKGCTPKGLRIPESEQYKYNRFLPTVTYLEPTISLPDPIMDIPKPSTRSVRIRELDVTPQEERGWRNNTHSNREITTSPGTSLQTCHCGWSKITTYHGLRTHQGMNGCTPQGLRIPESEQPRYNSFEPSITTSPGTSLQTCYCGWSKVTTYHGLRTHQGMNGCTPKGERIPEGAPSTDFLPRISNSNKGFGTNYISGAAQFSATDSVTRIYGNQTNPTNSKVKTVATNQTSFETPQKITGTATGARRALDFSTGTQQAKRDKIRADILSQIQKRKQKMERIKTSELDCKCHLDAEWLEINNVFSDVLKVVEEARRKALEPLEERGKKLEKEARVLVRKLHTEIDELKTSMNELDQNQDLEIPPSIGFDEPQSWKNVTLDTSFSFASLRATPSKMVERIQMTLEKLTSTELKRIPKFAVDVKLDPTTAHPCLEVSRDGKTVSNGGQAHLVPDCPQRFDVHGSILGTNRLTSGKAYWEVEVRNKSGWDLGVARGDVARKGKLSVNTNMGYWVIVHYEDKNYAALTVPPVKVKVAQKPQLVGVFVDYEERLVSFYDVTTKAHIYSFTDCAFSGDIYPYFSPHLKQNDRNSAPLVISAVNRQQ